MTTETFIFRKEWLEALDELQEQSRSRVIYALVTYAFTPVEERDDFCPLEDTAERIAYRFIRKCIDRDQDAYSTKVSNGRRGGAPKGNANASKTTEKQPKTTEKQPKTTEVEMETTEKQPKNNRKTTENNLIQSQSQSQSHSQSQSYFSSFADVFGENGSEEEEQQQEVASYLMLDRNGKDAQESAKALIAYNNLPDHTPLFSQSATQRKACMDRWKIEDGRFSSGTLEAWSFLYSILNELEAPLSVRKAATDDNLKITKETQVVRIHCPKILYMAIELFIDELRPAMMMLQNSNNASAVRYKPIDIVNEQDKMNTQRLLAELVARKRDIDNQ